MKYRATKNKLRKTFISAENTSNVLKTITYSNVNINRKTLKLSNTNFVGLVFSAWWCSGGRIGQIDDN